MRLTAENELAYLLDEAGLPFEREVTLVAGRRWRVDFLIAGCLVVEVEGTLPGAGGRHQRQIGFERDAEKYAEIIAGTGFPVLRVTTGQVRQGKAMGWIRRILEHSEVV